jgi:hypothetical protein
MTPETELWRTVLLVALRDAAKPASPADAAWMRSRDFETVCQLAGMEAEAVRRALAYHPERFTRSDFAVRRS